MKRSLRLGGPLKTLMSWFALLSFVWVALIICLFFRNHRDAFVAGVFFLVYLGIMLAAYLVVRSQLAHDLIDFAAHYSQVQKELLDDFVLPYALLDDNGQILWGNKAFSALADKKHVSGKTITSVFPDITKESLPGVERLTECEFTVGKREYRAAMKRMPMDVFSGENTIFAPTEGENNFLTAFYAFEETELNELTREKENKKLVCGLLNIDNYEEVLESVEEVRQSMLMAFVERQINRSFAVNDGIVRKLDKDRFFFVLRKEALDKMKEERFPLLDDVKKINMHNTIAVTLSMGIGLNAPTYVEDAEAARVALELALGRGGDQVVIRDGHNTTYFGGKTMSVEKSNRVKARVKAHALREIMSARERIFVMGHPLSDIDALGAAIGIRCAAKTIDKEVHIIVNDPQTQIRGIMEEFQNAKDATPQMFVTSREAMELAKSDDMVIMVDTNRPTYTECNDILNRAGAVVVIDHHRQGKEVVRNAVLNYVEPYASSACEMVAEILQYFGDKIKLSPLEADALYGGIMVDTNNFQTGTGVRTFEAAAFLRRNGVNISRVRKRFRDDMGEYKAKAQIVAAAEIFEKYYAISAFSPEHITNPTVVCAQAANDLLNVVGIKASFVLTTYSDKVYISARAIDEINVQLIMERLGGGGHMNIAGAQLTGTTIEEAEELLKKTILEMTEEGAIS